MKKNYILLLALSITTFSFSQNLVANGNFEDWAVGLADWTTIESGISVEQETTIINEGSSSVKVTLSTVTQENTDFRQTINVTSGVTYNVSVDVYHVGGDNDSRVRIYIDGFKNYSSPSTVGTWQTITTTYTATATEAIEVGLRFYDVQPFDSSSVIYVDNFKVEAPTTLSVSQSVLPDFSVYPNPTNTGFVNIKTASNANANISVFNVLGKQVISSALNNNRLDVSDLNSGVYVLQLNQNGATTTKKLVIK